MKCIKLIACHILRDSAEIFPHIRKALAGKPVYVVQCIALETNAILSLAPIVANIPCPWIARGS